MCSTGEHSCPYWLCLPCSQWGFHLQYVFRIDSLYERRDLLPRRITLGVHYYPCAVSCPTLFKQYLETLNPNCVSWWCFPICTWNTLALTSILALCLALDLWGSKLELRALWSFSILCSFCQCFVFYLRKHWYCLFLGMCKMKYFLNRLACELPEQSFTNQPGGWWLTS